MQSVLQQTYEDVEYLIIDGGSSDGTLDVIKRYPVRYVSEPDAGIYDALNKGLKLARGDVIGFLHADDVFFDHTVLQSVAEAFADANVAGCYGDLRYVQADDISVTVRHWHAGHYTRRSLQYGWMPPHPTLYLRRSVYEKIGGFDCQYRIAADYDLMLRLLYSHAIGVRYIPKVLVCMRTGGVSNRSLATILQKMREDLHILHAQGVGGVMTLIFKNLRKLKQLKIFALLGIKASK